MNRKIYTIQAGRGIVCDGLHLCTLAWPHLMAEQSYLIPPSELDALAVRIVALLNADERQRAIIKRLQK